MSKWCGAMPVALVVALALGDGCSSTPPAPVESAAPLRTFAAARARPTTLNVRGPAPMSGDRTPPEGFSVVHYPSAVGPLMAWVGIPNGTGPFPTVVFVHRGFALRRGDLERMRPFLDAGIAIFAPSFRGENENPGHYELWRGELDDLLAAGRFAATIPQLNPRELNVFGHSAGGGLVGLLALVPDIPFARLATSGGIYTEGTLQRWAQIPGRVPFAVDHRDEVLARVVMPHVDELKHPLWVFAGREDVWGLKHAREFARRATLHPSTETLVRLTEVEGEHGPSLFSALDVFRNALLLPGH